MLEVKRKPRSLNLMTIQGAADYTGLSAQTVRRAIKTGELNHYRAGRQIRIDESDLVNWLSLSRLRWL